MEQRIALRLPTITAHLPRQASRIELYLGPDRREAAMVPTKNLRNPTSRHRRRRGHFPTEQAALKVLYLVIRNPVKGRANVTGETRGWKNALNALALYYGDRITLN